MRTLTTFLICAALLGLSACQTPHPPKDDDGLAGPRNPRPSPPMAPSTRAAARSRCSRIPIAHHVGDIVTIVLNEQTAAQKSSSTNTNKATTQYAARHDAAGQGAHRSRRADHEQQYCGLHQVCRRRRQRPEQQPAGLHHRHRPEGAAQRQPVREGREMDRHQPGPGIRAHDGRHPPHRSRARQLHTVLTKWPTRKSPMAARAHWPTPMPRAGCRASSIHRGHRSDV